MCSSDLAGNGTPRAIVQELFSALRVKGGGGLDHSGVITLLEDLAGVSA